MVPALRRCGFRQAKSGRTRRPRGEEVFGLAENASILSKEVNFFNKTELINAVAERSGLTKKAANDAVEAVLESITNALANGEKVTLVGFGTFEVRERAARKGVNPATGEPIDIPAAKVPAFKAGKALRDAVK